MTDWIDIETIIYLYTEIIKIALPIAFIFGMGNILFDLFTGAAFYGVLHFRGR